jgi:hypothetical protein
LLKSANDVGICTSPGRKQRRFVDEIGEIGAGKTRRERCDLFGVDVGRDFYLLHVNLQDLHAAPLVGPVHQHLAVEPAGAQQRGIENLGPVGGRQNHQPRARVEAVELDQQLVERLLLLVVAAGVGADAARPAERVEFVDEDDGGRLLRACWNRSRTRAAPTPTNISTNSEPEIERTAPSLHRRPPWPTASCRCRAGRPATRLSACGRRAGRSLSDF